MEVEPVVARLENCGRIKHPARRRRLSGASNRIINAVNTRDLNELLDQRRLQRHGGGLWDTTAGMRSWPKPFPDRPLHHRP